MRNSSICVDASLVVRLVVRPDDSVVQSLWEQWSAESRPLVAPSLLLYEVTNALHRYRRSGDLTNQAANLALEAALAIPLKLYGQRTLHLRAMALATQFDLSATYDAHYLAVAEWTNGEFWTGDQRLARVVRPSLSWVHAVAPVS
jgi:predicted nucleic acid-binding protein